MAAVIGTLAWLALLMSSVGCQNLLCPSSCSCLGSFVDCSKRGLIEIPKDLPFWVEMLHLQNNDLTSVADTAFSDLHSLVEINLSHNQIRTLNTTGFRHLNELQILKIEHNHLSDIPDLGYLPNLTTLHLSNNEIFTISRTALENYPNLKTLHLGNNKIVDIPSGIFPDLAKLVTLQLNNNRIVSLEKGCLDNLTSLESLRLDKNRLNAIPKSLFQKLGTLKTLDLNRNKLQQIDGLVFDGLNSLEILKLKYNNIIQLFDGAFWGLNNIKSLHIDHNNITRVAKGWLYGLSSLRHLSLSYNPISEIDDFGWEFCKQLQELDLRYNELKTITKEMLKNLNSLRKLYLSHNFILYIEEGSFRSLNSLHILELNNNEISWTIEDTNGAFAGMEKLKDLNLSHNHIKSVAKKAFIGLPRLLTLDLTYNPITSIQEGAFSELKRLQHLQFNSSNLLCDCSLQWFPDWLKLFEFHQSVIAKCSHPEWLKNKSVLDVNPENFTCDDFPKPYITQHPQTQVALKDDNITLVCKAASSSDSTTTFQWRKNDKLLSNAEMENFATAGKGSIIDYASLLHIRFSDNKDEGQYQCVISNKFGSVYSQKAHITIHVFPTFTKTPEDITVRVDSVARLECAAEGLPTPEIAWQKDGGDDFPAARERRMHVMPSDDVFFIVDVKPFDMGIYTCTAKNDAGIVMANASLTVLETPSFVKAMKDKETRSGETAVLECLASGSPKPKLTWTKDGGPLIATERHFFTVDNQLLIIVQTQVSDSGEYTCEMSNTLGTERDSSYLTIYSATDRESGSQDDSTATGIIVIAVVCCVVGTSLVWIIIIYQTRKRAEEYAPTNSDEATLPSELAPFAAYPTTCTEEYKGSAPHLFLDSNSEHSSKDSGTGDSAKHSNDELLPSDGVKHHSLILLNDRTHLTHLVRGSSLGSILGAQSDISDEIGQSCPSTYTTTGSGQSSAGTPQQHTPLLHNIHATRNSKRSNYHNNSNDLKNIHDNLNKAPVIPSSEVTRWPIYSPCRSFSAEHLINKKNEKSLFPRIDYIETPKNSSNEKMNILCGSVNLERDCGVSTFPHSSSPVSNHSWSMGSLHPLRPLTADQDETKNLYVDLQSTEQTSDNNSLLSLPKISKNSILCTTLPNNTKQFPIQRVIGLTSNSSMHVGIV